jgi:NAD(P)-dependent dehydrogenase (short-subunit alcohol dehydrogenase family)
VARVWLVTGASSGFGRAICEAARAGGDVVVGAARRTDGLGEGGVRLDVADAAACEAVVADVIERHGRIDVLVNNAGRTHVGAAETTTDAELRELFDVHFFGPAALVRAVLPRMRQRRSGAIVQMSSVGGQLSFAGFGAYSATKCALEGFSEALADEVRAYGVRVLIVEPGAFRTSLFAAGSASRADPAYADTVGATSRMVDEGNGSQPGDPAKAAAAILAALDAEDPPLRLALGADAVDAIGAHLESVRAELTAWETVARDTAFTET